VAEVPVAGLGVVEAEVEKKVERDHIIKLIRIKRAKTLNTSTSSAVKQAIFRKIAASIWKFRRKLKRV